MTRDSDIRSYRMRVPCAEGEASLGPLENPTIIDKWQVWPKWVSHQVARICCVLLCDSVRRNGAMHRLELIPVWVGGNADVYGKMPLMENSNTTMRSNEQTA